MTLRAKMTEYLVQRRRDDLVEWLLANDCPEPEMLLRFSYSLSHLERLCEWAENLKDSR